jgi:hypothetical protein
MSSKVIQINLNTCHVCNEELKDLKNKIIIKNNNLPVKEVYKCDSCVDKERCLKHDFIWDIKKSWKCPICRSDSGLGLKICKKCYKHAKLCVDYLCESCMPLCVVCKKKNSVTKNSKDQLVCYDCDPEKDSAIHNLYSINKNNKLLLKCGECHTVLPEDKLIMCSNMCYYCKFCYHWKYGSCRCM